MKHNTILVFVLLIMLPISLFSQVETAKYWVGLKDKNNNQYSLENPSAFLSPKAIERRTKQGIAIEENDLPVSKAYIDSLSAKGVRIVTQSKWLNGVVIETDNALVIKDISAFQFVDTVIKCWTNLTFKHQKGKFNSEVVAPWQKSNYGNSYKQLAMHQGDAMHNLNFKGQGMYIALLDAGYYHVNSMAAFSKLWSNNQIKGWRDMVNPTSNFWETHTHGMSVLSVMGGFVEGELIGAAPEANYFLIRTEDDDSEFPVEMDYYVAGAELADSLGCDILNSSLGYTLFDDTTMNFTFNDLNGNGTRVTRAANIAASKGMIVVSSAGNDGGKLFNHISAPADGNNVLAVGSISADSIYSSFSSIGPNSAGRVKPDVVANGQMVFVQGKDGVGQSNGTSFSSPIMAGMAALLWQSLPQKSALEIKKLIKEHSNRYQSPNAYYGYGIPNVYLAMQKANGTLDKLVTNDYEPLVYPNPFKTSFSIAYHTNNKPLIVKIFNLAGELCFYQQFTSNSEVKIATPNTMQKGVYLLEIEQENQIVRKKIVRF